MILSREKEEKNQGQMHGVDQNSTIICYRYTVAFVQFS